jgi:hypothetical protein
MNETTLERFQALADRALSGDVQAEKDFFSEAAELFPLDFKGQYSPEDARTPPGERVEKIERALVLIRETITKDEE